MSESPELHRLIYASLVTPDTAAALPERTRDILAVSRELNGRDRITGLLVSDGHWFLQALEGDEAKVDACFERIQRDERHHWVTVRSRGPVARREFSRWSMCALGLSPLDNGLMQAPDIAIDVFYAAPGALLQMMTGLAARFGRQLDRAHDGLLWMVDG